MESKFNQNDTSLKSDNDSATPVSDQCNQRVNLRKSIENLLPVLNIISPNQSDFNLQKETAQDTNKNPCTNSDFKEDMLTCIRSILTKIISNSEANIKTMNLQTMNLQKNVSNAELTVLQSINNIMSTYHRSKSRADNLNSNNEFYNDEPNKKLASKRNSNIFLQNPSNYTKNN